MAEQVQCPNCGGYRVETSEVETLWDPVPLDERKKAIFSFPLIAPFAILFAVLFPNFFRKSRGKLYHYYCYLCGYKWAWETGTPTPQVNVRPDLIAKGEQRLEEERRRREEEYRHAGMWMKK